MTVDISVIIGVAGLALTAAGFFIGRLTAARKEAQDEARRDSDAAVKIARVESDVIHIKALLEKLDKTLENNNTKMDGRIEEISAQLASTSKTAIEAQASAKSAHHRLDELTGGK